MSVTPSPIGGFAAQFFDNNGQPLSGGKIYTYAAGTTLPQATYTSALGITPHANPIILDSAGRVPGGEIWLTDGLVYKFKIDTATDVLIGTYDNITGVNSNFVNYTVQEEVITATAGQTVFNLATINYTPATNSLSVFVDGVNQYAGDSYLETDSNTVTFTAGLHVGAEVKFTTAIQTTTGAVDASTVSYDPPFTGGVLTNVEDKLAQYVSVKDFGAVCDGVADDTAAVQAAINYCLSNAPGAASTLMINGVCRLGSSLKLDIAINDTTNRLIIYGNGERAGFYTSTNVNMFDTNFPGTTDPVSGNVTFENIVFETSSNLNNSFVLNGGKFLRMYFVGCEFYKIRCLSATIYTQSYRFERCRVRSTLDRFFESAGMYDIHAQIDGKFCVTGFRSLDTVRGITESSFTECVWEGNSGSLIECTGANGLTVANNYIEFNSALGCNFALGLMPNNAITVQGNIFVQATAQASDPNFYDIDWGLTVNGTSVGNYCNGKLHKGLSATDCVSIGDSFFGVINSPNIRTINAVTRFGLAQDVWEDSANQFNKSSAGNFGLNVAAQATSKLTVAGADQTASNFAGSFLDSNGNIIAAFRNDRRVTIPALANYANDAAAAAGGVPVGYLYRNGSVVQVRVT